MRKRRAFTLIELLVLIAIIAILAAIAIPNFTAAQLMRLPVLPRFGYPVAVTPVPATIVGTDEWISGEKMATCVADALVQTVGKLQPADESSGSYALKQFRDIDRENNSYRAWGGIWSTDFSPTPSPVLQGLSRTGLPIGALNSYALRRIRIRYSTSRLEKDKAPGEFRLEFQVEVRAQSDAKIEEVTVPSQVQSLIADVVERLQAGK